MYFFEGSFWERRIYEKFINNKPVRINNLIKRYKIILALYRNNSYQDQ